MPSVRLWIVNPAPAISERWQRLAKAQGWSVESWSALERFREALSEASVGLALLDWVLLRRAEDGVLPALRARAPGVSLVLTAGEELANEQIVRMLEAGADDFLPHSMHADLFVAKLKAHLRRLVASAAGGLDVLRAPHGDLKLDRSRHEVMIKERGGKWVSRADLTPTELGLLALFLERPGVALARRFIMDALWQSERDRIRPGTVDKHVESLRKKLGRLGERIQTVYGVGYTYRET